MLWEATGVEILSPAHLQLRGGWTAPQVAGVRSGSEARRLVSRVGEEEIHRGMMVNHLAEGCKRAAEIVADAEALLVGAGAGMGVDSGLPDFRGQEGFWKAYPPFREKRLSFVDLANPVWFRADPERAWGFYGHRLNLYRAAVPHDGFGILRSWGEGMSGGY